MEVKNNPAGRLFEILNAAKNQPPKEPARKVWATVFDINPSDTGALLKLLADVIDLVHETKASVQRIDDIDHDLHLRPFKKIESLLSQLNLDAGWEHWKNQIDDTTLYGLQISADKLSRISGYSEVKDDELADIRGRIDEFFNSVTDSELPQELKLLILRNLEAIRLAFVAYRIRGIEGLQEELERSIGSVLLHQEDIKKSCENEADKEVWGTFFKLVEKLNKVISLARNAKEIAGPAIDSITKLLGSS